MLITFSGLDGAGKSTLIGLLREDLAAVKRRAVVLHLNDHVGIHAYLRMLRNRVGVKSPNPDPSQWQAEREREARDVAHPTSWKRRLRARVVRLRNALVWSKTLRGALYPFDLLVFLAYRFWLERVQRRVIIMDRYFYDTLVDFADGRRRPILRLLERITPVPDLPIYIDVDPETAFARKGEYSVEYLRRRHAGYRTVFPWVPSHVKLPSGDLGATRAALREAALARMAAR